MLVENFGIFHKEFDKFDWDEPSYNEPFFFSEETEFKILFSWQQDCFNTLKDKKKFLIRAPTGSGKTTLTIALAIYIALKFKLKILILCPQKLIVANFARDKIKLPNGQEYNFFAENFTSNTEGLKEWMLKSPEKLLKHINGNTIQGIVAVSTQQAFNYVMEEFSSEQKKEFYKNTFSIIDEGHHLKGLNNTNNNEQEKIENCLSSHINWGIQNVLDFRLGILTATPFRHDKAYIISPELLYDFEIYTRSFYEHFLTLKLEYFHVEYIECDKGKYPHLRQVINKIKQEPNERHSIILPPQTTKWRQKNGKELHYLLTELKKIINDEEILDLISLETQEKNKLKLYEHNKKGLNQYKVIISCALFNEGTDWPPCSRVHNTDVENSITLLLQRAGRPLRYYKEKKNIKLYYYIDKLPKPKKGMSIKDLLTDRTNIMFVTLLFDDLLNPNEISPLPKKKRKNKEEIKRNIFSLVKVFGDINKFNEVYNQIIEKCVINELNNKIKSNFKKVLEITEEICKKYFNDNELLEKVKYALTQKIFRKNNLKLSSTPQFPIEILRENGIELFEGIEFNSKVFFRDFSKEDFEEIKFMIKTKDFNLENLEEFLLYLKEFINEFGREPSFISKSPFEKKLARKRYDFIKMREEYLNA